MNNYIKQIIVLAVCLFIISCEKNYLEKRPDKALLVPSTLADMKALLENTADVFSRAPGLHVISTDDFFTTASGWASYISAGERNAYIWAPDIFEGGNSGDWETCYKQVLVSNVVLEGLMEIDKIPQEELLWDQVKGTALFQRAFAFFNLAQTFAAPYDVLTAKSKLGIPIRLSSDVNIKSVRASLDQTYSQILSDVTKAETLLPVKGRYTNQPGKDAARALLAKIYLIMGDYVKAESFAKASLELTNDLIDYNTLTASAARPLPSSLPSATNIKNPEVLFHAILVAYSFSGPRIANTLVNTDLFGSYVQNDLRKAVFFTDRGNGVVNFKGNYTGNASFFSGLTTSEVYLIQAECAARNGNITSAMNVLNGLLEKRWKKNTFVQLKASTANDALRIILSERRKEMIARGTRWSDLRRLNKEPEFAVTLVRDLQGTKYSLPPNDDRYVFPIPPNEIQLSGLEQNPR